MLFRSGRACDATGGYFALTFDGLATSLISHDASLADVRAELMRLSNVNNVTVDVGCVSTTCSLSTACKAYEASNDAYLEVTFVSVTEYVGAVPLLQMTSNVLLEGARRVDVWTLRHGASPLAGSFRLTFRGATTVAIDVDDSAGVVETKLTDLDTIEAGGVPLLRGFSCELVRGARIGIVGPNGAGKSTLLKLMLQELLPTEGDVRVNPHLRIGRYNQHSEDVLDLNMNPLDFMDAQYPDGIVTTSGKKKMDITDWRGQLGVYGISGKRQTLPMVTMSPGFRARVVFCLMSLRNPQLLLLDEPTNPLDMDMIDSLALAIKEIGRAHV